MGWYFWLWLRRSCVHLSILWVLSTGEASRPWGLQSCHQSSMSTNPLQPSHCLQYFSPHSAPHSFFPLGWKNVRYYSGHGSLNLTFKLYTRSYHTFGDISLPLMPSDGSRSIFFASLRGVSGEGEGEAGNTYESSVAWGHALLIAHLNEVIHNVAAL